MGNGQKYKKKNTHTQKKKKKKKKILFKILQGEIYIYLIKKSRVMNIPQTNKLCGAYDIDPRRMTFLLVRPGAKCMPYLPRPSQNYWPHIQKNQNWWA